MGGGSGQTGGGRSREGIRVEFSCNDGAGLGGSREVMEGASEGESPPECRVHRRQGGTGGRMVSRGNEQRSQLHSKEDQDLCQIKEVVEHRHQRKEKGGRKGEKKKAEFGGGHQGEGRAPEVDSAVQEPNVE